MMPGVSPRGNRPSIALGFAVACLAALAAWAPVTRGQEAISDSLWAATPSQQPISYFTTYDLNISRSTWGQTLSYNHSGNRVSFGADLNTNVLTPVRGLETEGRDGNIAGRLNVRATDLWLWSVDGLFNTNSNEDNFSSTKRRQNKVQIRTQYSASIFPGLTGMGLAYSELQQEQGLSRKSIPPDTLARDSTYTSGRRDGIFGKLKWNPSPVLELNGTGSGNWNHLTTKTTQRKYVPLVVGGGSSLVHDSLNVSETPTGDERYLATAHYRGISKTLMGVSLESKTGTQTMYAFTRRGLDTLSWYDRSANLRIEHNPIPGAQLLLEGSFAQTFREYQLQNNFNSLGRTHSGSANFNLARPTSRVSAGFQLSRVRNDRQISQNGEVLHRAVNTSGAKRITNRLWLDGTGTLSLFSRRYDDGVADKDDFRGYANVGGGYRVSSRCSTSVHFSATRTHAVSISARSSADNNLQTLYQMDASLRLQVSRTFQILQNYQLNANYFIYDFDIREGRNTLSRVRRINTVLSDSLFDFAVLRLTHNFLAQDFGSYSRTEDNGPRKYEVILDSYVQNLSLTADIRLMPGIVLVATQSLGNTRNYNYTPRSTTNTNRWNLNLGAQIDRVLPGEMLLQGSIQHIGEYTEAEGNLPVLNSSDYWLVGATLQKDF